MTEDNLSTPYEAPTAWDLAGAVTRSWTVVLLSAFLAAVTALVVSSQVLPETYESTATLLVSPAPPDEESPSSDTFFSDDQSVGKTFEELALQPVVAAAVARTLDVDERVPLRRVRVHSIPKTPLIEVTYSASTAEGAARGARAYSDVFAQAMSRGQWMDGKATIVSGARLPDSPAAPHVLLNTVVAAVAGLVFAIGGACLVEQTRSHRRRGVARDQQWGGADRRRATDAPAPLAPPRVEHDELRLLKGRAGLRRPRSETPSGGGDARDGTCGA